MGCTTGLVDQLVHGLLRDRKTQIFDDLVVLKVVVLTGMNHLITEVFPITGSLADGFALN